MATYTNATCSRCGLQLPRNEFQPWDEEIETSRKSTTYRQYANGRVGVQGGGSTYKIDHQLLCPTCYSHAEALRQEERDAEFARRAEIAAREKRARRTVLLLVSLVVLGIVVALAWNAMNGRQPESRNRRARLKVR